QRRPRPNLPPASHRTTSGRRAGLPGHRASVRLAAWPRPPGRAYHRQVRQILATKSFTATGEHAVLAVEAPNHMVLPSVHGLQPARIWAPALSCEAGRHFPRTRYWRTASARTAPATMFHEFVVPLHGTRSHVRVLDWAERIQAGQRPVALSIALGERRQPAN